MSAASASTPVFVARDALTPGQAVDATHLKVAEVRLSPDDLDRYLDASEPVPDGLVATRVVGEGELVPRAALAERGTLDLHPVAIDLDLDPGATLSEGSLVDLWFVPGAGPAGADGGEPERLAQNLVVHTVATPSGLQASRGSTVHVLVPSDLLPSVLAATARDGHMRVLPVLGGI